MADFDTEEQRRAAGGVVTPDASQGEDWRRQVAGVYSFGDDDPTPTPGAATPNRLSLGIGLGL